MNIIQKALLGGFAIGYALNNREDNPNCFIYRDDIGAYWGIHGYEEQVTEVGTHRGQVSWPQYRFFGTFDSGSVRRGNTNLSTLQYVRKCIFSFVESNCRLPGIHTKLL